MNRSLFTMSLAACAALTCACHRGGPGDTSTGEATELERVQLEVSPMALFAAMGAPNAVADLQPGSVRVFFFGIWDEYLPDLEGPDDPRLDPAADWELDAWLETWACWEHSAGIEFLATLRPVGASWGNQAVYEAYEQGLVTDRAVGWPAEPETWLALVRKTVERLDGDGQDDLACLVSPVRHWQVENEFYDQWMGDPQSAAEAQANADEHAPEQAEAIFASFVELQEQTIAVIRDEQADAFVVSPSYHISGAAFVSGRLPDDVECFPYGAAAATGSCELDDHGSPEPEGCLSREELAENTSYLWYDAIYDYVTPQIAPLVDAFDYHLYRDHRYHQPSMDELNARQLEAGLSEPLPLWTTEHGAPFYDYDLEVHASEIVKNHLLFVGNGGQRLYWANLVPLETWGQNFQNGSLLDCDDEPRTPAYDAYRELVSVLIPGAAVIRHTLAGAPDVVVYTVSPPEGDALWVYLWAEAGRPSVTPAHIPGLADASALEAAGITSATTSGLALESIDPSNPVELSDEVMVMVAR